MKLLVIADDFTGANDTGVQFNKSGLTVDVLLDSARPYQGCADVVIVNTNSRAMLIENAQEQIKNALSIGSVQHIYKKLDSTLRGNIGAEIAACMNISGRNFAFVCSALPEAGRTIENGICHVNGIPLAETEFASDPKTPITSSNVSMIICAQTDIPVLEINLSQLRDTALCKRLIQQACQQYAQCIFAFDSTEQRDLRLIGEQIKQFDQPSIVAGSSGLAKYLHIETKIPAPVLIVAGSMSETTAKQVEYLKNNPDVTVIDINVEALLTVNDYPQQITERALNASDSQQHIVLKTENSRQARNNVARLCEKLMLKRSALGEQISEKLALITAQILKQRDYRFAALFLTGGDIAIAVAKALSLHYYRISGEIEGGVPLGYFPESVLEKLPVITKAGGFGSLGVLRNTIDFINNINEGV